MRPPGSWLALGLFSAALSACSLFSLDDLQEVGGAGGAASTSVANGSSSDAASVASGETAATSSGASNASGVSASSQVSGSQASSGTGTGTGGAGGGDGGGGAGPTSLYAEAVLADGPIAYLHLDELAGENTVVDAVGDFDGTLIGGVTWREPSAIANDAGTSIRFDGATAQLNLGDVLDFEGGGPFSVELWAKTGPEDPPTIEWLFSKEADFETDRKGYSCLISTEILVGAEIWAGFPPTVAYTDGPITKETWHHVVMSASPTTLDIWVDGIRYDDGGNAAALVDNGGALTFAAQTGGQGHFDGWLDEIAIYDVALSSDQIAAHRAAAE